MKTQKGLTPVLVLVVVAILGVGAYLLIPKPGGIEYIKKQLTWPRPTPTFTPPPGCSYEEVQCIKAPCEPVLVCPTPSPAVDETANWKTYTNGKHRYTVKYPVGMIVEEKDNDYVWFDKQILIQVSKVNPEDCRGDCPVIQAKESLTINNQEAQKLTGYIGAIGGNTPQSYEEIVFPYRDNYYSLVVYELKNDVNLPDSRQIGKVPKEKKGLFNQILSTFKFLE